MAIATLRAEFRAGLYAIAEAWRTANPTYARQSYAARPATFHPPLIYVGPFSEPTITHETGNRLSRPDLRGSLIIVEGLYDNEESLERLDEKTDSLLVYLATQHARVAGQLLEAKSAEDVELVIKEVPYAASAVTVGVSAP